MLESRGRPELAALRSAQTGGASQIVEARKRAPRDPVLLGGAEGECEEPTATRAVSAKRARREQRRLTPLWLRREAQRLATRAYSRASITDSRRLFEQSVATRVRRGRKARASQGTPRTRGAKTPGSLWLRRSSRTLLPFFVDTKKGSRPRGRNPRTALRTSTGRSPARPNSSSPCSTNPNRRTVTALFPGLLRIAPPCCWATIRRLEHGGHHRYRIAEGIAHRRQQS